jgi:RNA polymerase sigma factor (sigma-70 family)
VDQSSDDIGRLAHDPDALERFYRAHVQRVERFVVRRVSDPQLAADLTAEVFLAVIDGAPRYRPGKGTAVGWLYGVAWHVVAAHQRDQARRLRAHSRISGRALVDSDDIEALVSRIDAEALSRALSSAMAQLPSGERAVLELTAVDGLTVTEAADALGIRPVTARVRLHRARRTLRSRLATPEPTVNSDRQPVPEEIP